MKKRIYFLIIFMALLLAAAYFYISEKEDATRMEPADMEVTDREAMKQEKGRRSKTAERSETTEETETANKEELYLKNKASIAAGASHTVALKPDGTVVAVGDNTYGQTDVSDWTDIVAVAAGWSHTVGLKKDGTVVAVGDNSEGQTNVSDWKNITNLSAAGNHTVGIASSGVIIDSSKYKKNMSKVTFVAAGSWHTVALQQDGTVKGYESSGYVEEWGQVSKLSDWKDLDIISLAVGGSFTVGLKSDGTIVAAGHGEIAWFPPDWKDIVSISASGSNTVALNSNGTVVSYGSNTNEQEEVSGWKDIIAVSAAPSHTVGLRSDGTVVSTRIINKEPEELYEWNHIASLAVGMCKVSGLKKDGTAVVAAVDTAEGYFAEEDRKEELDLRDWENVISIGPCSALKEDGTAVTYKEGRNRKRKGVKEIIYAYGGDDEVFLYKNGTVVYSGDFYEVKKEVKTWKDIQKISMNYYAVAGIKSDGTVVVAGYEKKLCEEVEKWENIADVKLFEREAGVAGIRTDGTVAAAGGDQEIREEVEKWENIADMKATDRGLIGIKTDGSVVVTERKAGITGIKEWTDIRDVLEYNGCYIGIQSDGAVAAEVVLDETEADKEEIEARKLQAEEMSGWKQIDKIVPNQGISEDIMGLKQDGSVVISSSNQHAAEIASTWKDIVDIYSDDERMIGVKSDGTLVFLNWDDYGQTDVGDWEGIGYR